MDTLHVTPTSSAGNCLAQALREAELSDDVIMFDDDLSCGPIDPLDSEARTGWWKKWHKLLCSREHYESLYPNASADQFWVDLSDRFWEDLTSTSDRLIVWFSRHSASDFCFYLAVTARLAGRPFHVIDVAGRSYQARDGSTRISQAHSVSQLHPNILRSLFDQELPLREQERDAAEALWQRLRTENAPFRVVTDAGCKSALVDHFDPAILAQASPDGQTSSRLVGDLMATSSDSSGYYGALMLRSRIVALVEQGQLLADGDARERDCRIRLPPGF